MVHFDAKRFNLCCWAQKLNIQTAGTATNKPKAVVINASEMPPATAERPVDFSEDMPWKALMILDDRAEQPHEGAVASDRRQSANTALQFGIA